MPRRRRPGPVVTAGVEALLVRREELAKGWLLALVEDAPLEEAAAIMAGDVARDGPRICDAVVRAVYNEQDLRRIEPGGVLEPLVSCAGELAGVRSAEGGAHAVETLRSVIWSALRSELARADPDLLADAGERLSLVAELVRAAVLRRRCNDDTGVAQRPRVAPLRVESGGVRDDDQPGTAASGDSGPETDFAADPAVGDALWIGALRDEILRSVRARSGLSLLLVELADTDRMLAVEPRGEATATFGRFAQAVRAAVRHRDVLACETESRAWIIARDTGRAGAQALGARIVAAVPTEESRRGAPLTVSVGLAVLGEDGHNAATLIDAAEEAKSAAEASGLGIVTNGPEGGAEPPAPGPSLVS